MKTHQTTLLNKFLGYVLLFCLIGFSSFAQQKTTSVKKQTWVEKMQNPAVNFYDVQNAFNSEFAGKEREMQREKYKATKKLKKSGAVANGEEKEEGEIPGWELYKRWEYRMAPRLYPSGDRTVMDNAWNDYLNNYQPQYSNQQRSSSNQTRSLQGSWSFVGPSSVPTGGGGAGRLNFVRFDPVNSNIIYVGAPSGGFWKSTNGGTSWTTTTDQLPVIGCTDLAINPNNGQVMYLATGDNDHYDTYSIGVYKSTDGGATWNVTGLNWAVFNTYRTISRLLINPQNPNVIFAASSNGIYKTANAGTSWTQVSGTNGMSCMDIEYRPSDTTTIYFTTSTAFYKSTNGGTSFSNIISGLPAAANVSRLSIGVSANDQTYVYVLASGTDYGFLGLYLSTNNGTNFSQQSSTPNLLGWNSNGADAGGQGWYTLSLAVNPSNKNEVVVGGVNIWRSTNAGVNWTINGHWTGSVAPYVHADIHALEYLPGSSTYFAACDGGLFKTTNSGTAWSDLSSNLQIGQMYRLGLAATNNNMLLTGKQDNGTDRFSGSAWSSVLGGDGMEAIIDWSNSNVQYGEVYYGEIYRTTSGGNLNTNIVASGGTGVNADGGWVTPYIMNPLRSTTLLVGKSQVFRSRNRGGSWSQVGSISISGSLTAMAYAPSDSNYIYVASGTKFYSSVNGTSFTDRTGTLPVGLASISYIAVANNNPSHVWVTLSGYSAANKVYYSPDAGVTWTNFTASGLPNLPVNCIVYQNNTNDGLYMGTDVGVYYRDNSLASWSAFSTGMPNVVVDELEIQYTASKLRAATFGRGIWESDLYSLPVADVSIAASATTICSGTSVTFTATPVNGGTTPSYQWQINGSNVGSNSPTFATSALNDSDVVTCIMTSNMSGVSGSPATSNSVTMIVNSLPTVGAAVSPSSTVCAGTAVTLSGTGASSYSWTGGVTNGTAFTPGATATYTVTGTTNGCSNTATQTITVNAIPTVGATVSPSSTVCAGTAVTLSGTGASSYSWTGGVTNGTAFTPGATATYTVTGTTNGCSNTATQTITVNTIPTVGATVSPSSTVCAGTAVTLSGTGASSYSWTGGVTNGTAFTPGATATYTVTGTSNGCSNTATQTITVNAIPTVGATVSPSSTVCAGTVVTLSGTGASSYSWTGGVTNGTAFTPGATATYTVTGTTNGCSNTATQTITVNAIPTVGATVSPSSTVCAGTGVSLSGTGASSYSWTGGVTNGTAFTPGATATYTVTGTSNGCSNTATQTITVNAIPTVGATASPSSTVCAGTAVTLSGTGASSYSWTGGVTNGTAFTPGATATYTVTGTSNGCSNTATQTITVNAIPTVGATVSPSSTVCAGTAVTLSGTGASSYSWTGGVTNGTAFTPGATATYTVTGTTNGCSNTATQTITVLSNFNITASAGANGSISPNGITAVCFGDNQTYTITPNGGYAILDVLVDGVSDAGAILSGTYTFTGVNSSHTISASFYFVSVCVAPSFTTCPGTQTGSTDAGLCSTVVNYTPTLSGTAPTITYSLAGATSGNGNGTGSGLSFNRGTTTITLTATNGCGTASCSFDIIVADNEAPVATVANLPMITGQCSTSATAPTATDNCSGTITATTSDPTSYSQQGTYTIHWNYSDGNGNSLTQNQTVTVLDNTLPLITAPIDITVCSGTSITLGTPVTSDNCYVASVVNNAPSSYPVGNTAVTWTVTDSAGNTATTVQNVTVLPNYTIVASSGANGSISPAGSSTVCAGGNQSYSISASAGYQILDVLIDGVSNAGAIGTGTYTFTNVQGNHTISATFVNGCTTPVGSATDIVICSGDASNLPLNSNVAGTSFTWTSSVISGNIIGMNDCSTGCGSAITDILTNIGSTQALVQYTITPTAGGCTGTPFTANVTVGAIPAAPGNISGPNAVCGILNATYSIAPILGATSYTWSITTGGSMMTIVSGQGTNSVNVNISTGSLNLFVISVQASNGCGSSAPNSISITKKPAVPGAISGPTSTCGQTSATFSIAPVFSATSYIWTLPAGMTYQSGAGTTQITVNIGSTFISGLLKVSAVNACGNVPGQTLMITGNVPLIPVTLSGPSNICALTTATYSIPAVAGATGYNWLITGTGNNISGSNTGTTATALFGGPGTISVAATNLCGTGIYRALNLVTTAIQPGTISGPMNTCGLTTASYSVAPVANASVYNWNLATGMTWGTGQGTNIINVNIAPGLTNSTATSILRLTETNTCGNTSLFRTTTITRCLSPDALNANSENLFSTIYPNPASSVFSIDMNMDMDKEIILELYDILGKIVIRERHTLPSGMSTITTNIESFNRGMYFVRIMDTHLNVIHTEPLIKQ